MKIRILEKYLAIPVSNEAVSKNLRFYDGEKLVYDLDIGLDSVNPTFCAYVDMERFAGMELEVAAEPAAELFMTPCAGVPLPDLYNEPYRPQVHFTVKNGWNNDPNGLVYVGGAYHMFYQYNPCANQWGNMHWGHAMSSDLLRWKELPTALYPDEMGTMYSGSAVVDRENVTGMRIGEDDPIVFFYTAAGDTSQLSRGKKFTQCAAFSADGGVTFSKFNGNPIIGHIEAGNRDPKVIWCQPLGAWLMALYLDDDRYALFRSDGLLRWTQFQTVSLPGDNECPDIFPLPAAGGEKWVLIGAHDMYLVGDFTDGFFTPTQEVKRLNYGEVYYAAQTFSDVPDGRRVRIGWNRLSIPERRFTQQMGIPTELSLTEENGVYTLNSWPVAEVATLYAETKYEEFSADNRQSELTHSAYDICLAIESADAPVRITVFGTEVVLDMEKGILTAGKCGMPVKLNGGTLELRFLSDRASLEIFTGGAVTTIGKTADYNLPYIRMDSTGNFTAKAEMHRLRSVWHSM